MLCYASKIFRLNSASEQRSVSMGGLRSLFRISSKSDMSGSLHLGGLGRCVLSALGRLGLCRPVMSIDYFLFLSLEGDLPVVYDVHYMYHPYHVYHAYHAYQLFHFGCCSQP